MKDLFTAALGAGLLALLLLYPSIDRMVLTSDGVNYLSIAENIAHGRGVANYTGQVELAHPFGYSLAMAPLIRVGMDSQSAAYTVNWLALMMIGVLTFLLLRDLTGRKDWTTALGTVAVMINPSLVIFSNWILSEALCVALALLFLWLCLRSKGWPSLILTSVVGVALCFTRYPAVAIVLGVAAFLRSWRERLVVAVPALLMAAFGTFNSRGAVVWQGAFWDKYPYIFRVPLGLADAVGGGLLVLLAVYLASLAKWPREFKIVATAAVLTILGLVWTVVRFGINPTLDLRLFVPVAIPVTVVVLSLLIRGMLGFYPYALGSLLLTTVLGIASVWPMKGKGLNDPALAKSQTIEFVKTVSPDTAIYSNCPAAIWLYTGRVTKGIANTFYADKQEMRARENEPRETGGVMIWFNGFGGGCLGPDKYRDIMIDYGADRVCGFEDQFARVLAVRKL